MREEILQEKMQTLLDAVGNSSKVEIIDFTKNTVFTKIDTKEFVEYKVYDVKDDMIFDLAKETTSLKSAYQFFLGRITSYIQLDKDDFEITDEDEYTTISEDFDEIKSKRGACIHREGTNNEYVTFRVLDRKEM